MEHLDAGERLIAGILDRLKTSGRVDIAFGESRAVGEKTVIPIAAVGYGFGGGAGFGRQPSETKEGDERSGGGSGGGGGLSVTPIAVLELGPEGTRLLPVIDWTKLASRAMGLILIWGIMRAIRRR